MEKRDSRVYLGSAKIEKIEGKKSKRDIYSKEKMVEGVVSSKQFLKKIPPRVGGCSSCRGNKKI